MTREEAIRKHRKMWNWLAENPGKWKGEYLVEFDPESELCNDCYLCEYTLMTDKSCDECPLEWLGRECKVYGGLYNTWCASMEGGNYAQAAEIARQIAELPEREEIE